MDLRVAVEAPFGQDTFTRTERQNIIAAVERRRMVSLDVALLAQIRRADFQQPRLARAVRGVTVGAVIPNRGVFPKERPAFFGVAGYDSPNKPPCLP